MLSAIHVDIDARIDRFEANMRRSADIAETSLSASAANADKFQTAFDRAADLVTSSSEKMAAAFEAANDRIMNAAANSTSSVEGIHKATDKLDAKSWSDKIATGLAAGFAAGYVASETWTSKMESFVETKMILIGAALAAGITIAATSAIYAAYKVVTGSIGFIAGLFTGESYKSGSIDDVIALNQQVKSLQEGLQLSADHASALNQALKAVGTDSGQYTSTLQAATVAAHTNTDELDRLGVRYKDANGKILDQQEILKSAKKVLDEYTAGYDRNAAAAAIGIGSYESISKAVSITTEKIETAGQRLVDYNLIVGEGTQEAVTAYENAMRVFQVESDLSAQAFKKAVADQIMPLLTDLETLFSDGWPKVINSFRYSMATLTSLFYGLKEVVQIVAGAVTASFGSIGDMVSRVTGAIVKAASGDMAGAWKDLQAIPSDLSGRWDKFWTGLVADSEKNVKAMKLAWGFDNFAAGSSPDPAKVGKAWVPKPKEESEARKGSSASDPTSPYQTFLDQLDQMNARMEANQYVQLKVRAAQLAWNEGISANAALLKIDALQIAESEKSVKDFSTRMEEENRRLLDARGSIGLYGIELEAHILREQRRAEVMQRINQLEAQGKPLTDAARDAMLAQADAAAKVAEAILRENDALSRTYEVGAKRAFDTYMDNATNAAKQAEQQFTNAYQTIEGAMEDFLFNPFENGVKGMLMTFGQAIQRMIAQAVAADLGKRLIGAVGTPTIGGLLNTPLGAMGVGGNVGAQGYSLPDTGVGAPTYGGDIGADISPLPAFAVGTDYVPRDMVALIHQGEKIIPAAQNNGAGGQTIHITVNVNGNQSAPDVRRSAGQGAREALAVLAGVRRYG